MGLGAPPQVITDLLAALMGALQATREEDAQALNVVQWMTALAGAYLTESGIPRR